MAREGEGLRGIPSVAELLALEGVRSLTEAHGHQLVVEAVRAATDRERQRLRHGDPPCAGWVEAVGTALQERLRPSLQPVINATGVVIHTNLGRVPLSEAALQAVAQVGGGYSNLEYKVEAGERGSRHIHAEALLRQLTGAEAALVTNNNAAAVLLTLAALAAGGEVVISRGQLVEIGGGFRIPDVMAQSGAKLVEVGTTNRTYLSDYEGALSEVTALFLYVHRSNFRLSGFVTEPTLTGLAGAAHRAGVLLYADLGSGALLDTSAYGLEGELTVAQCLEGGADLVSFSGDKLLGGPQAGIVVGKAEAIERLRRHPLMRAVRVDKMILAALEATLLAYRRGDAEGLPLWAMIAQTPQQLGARAEALRVASGLGEVHPAQSTVGGGSLPGEVLSTMALAVVVARPHELARQLRMGDPPVVARVEHGALWLDLRTVPPRNDGRLAELLRAAYDRYERD